MSQRKDEDYGRLDKWCNGEIERLMSTGPELITAKELKRRAQITADGNNWEIKDLNYWWHSFEKKYCIWNVAGAQITSRFLRITKLLD